jgi:hypothetical protein
MAIVRGLLSNSEVVEGDIDVDDGVDAVCA